MKVTRVSALRDGITLPSLRLLDGLPACFWLRARHVDTLLFHPVVLKWRADSVLQPDASSLTHAVCSEKTVGELCSGEIKALPTAVIQIVCVCV